jgi:hypothetical protein
VGSHAVSAAFSNDPNFNGSNGSLATPQSVDQASTTTTVGSSTNPSAFGTSVTFTATVAVVAPGSGTPSGNVQFEIDGTNVGSQVALDAAGKATYQTSALTVPGSPHAVKAYYLGTTSYKTSNGTLAGGQGITKVSTTTAAAVTPNSAQYSDVVSFEATISPAAVNGLNPATTATFKVGTQTMGTANFALVGGVWKATLSNQKLLETVAGQMAPGAHTVTAEISGIDPNFAVSNPTASLTIDPEDAAVAYAGLLFVSTPSASATTADVTLRATINDITAVDAASDANPGDIRKAKVKFVNRETGLEFPGCTNMTPTLIDASNTKSGTVSCTVTLQAGSGSDPSATYQVATVVSNYYDHDTDVDDELVTVTMGGTGFITGGGYITATASSGQYAATSGAKVNFGYNVKFNKNGTNLQGHVNVIVRKQVGGVWKIYQIKSNSITSLTPKVNPTGTGGTALFASKANLTDITNPAAPIALGGNMTFEMVLTDVGEPGSSDTIGFTLWSSGNTLVFSSKWDGSKTIEQLLGGGNLQVR